MFIAHLKKIANRYIYIYIDWEYFIKYRPFLLIDGPVVEASTLSAFLSNSKERFSHFPTDRSLTCLNDQTSNGREGWRRVVEAAPVSESAFSHSLAWLPSPTAANFSPD